MTCQLAQACPLSASAVALVLTTSLLLSGCTTSRYDMGETIEMGPFAFEVAGVSETVTQQHARPTKRITVQLQLVRNDSPQRNLLSFLEGSERVGVIAYPFYKLEDGHGHRFDNRGQASAPGLRINFDLRGSRRLTEDEHDRWSEEHRDMPAEDCWLIITNPDTRRGQPRAVSIGLR